MSKKVYILFLKKVLISTAEEVPSLMTPKTNPKTPKTPQTDPKASRKTALKTRKPPKLKLKASSSTESSGPELTDYIGKLIYVTYIH